MRIKFPLPALAIALSLTTLGSALGSSVNSAYGQNADTLIADTSKSCQDGTCAKAEKDSQKRGLGRKAKLNLSEDQKEKMLSIKNKYKGEMEPKIAELKEHKRSINDLLTRETIDKEAILKEQSKINAIIGDIASARLAYRIEANENLNPEQRATLRKLGEERNFAGRGKHHGKRGGKKGGNLKQKASAPSEA
ncbi:MAG: Spy/CpxP family protein refolding chaperone [Candidatus Obscuribacterales bacterium]|nr:Spy/CpxP family protein refolding chaperone [Candidatus Obscuribacterales bacterium]